MPLSILFHTPQPLDTLDSGSSVRPAKMIDAFTRLGHKVTTISGDASERQERIESVTKQSQGYDMCYSEPTTWPLHPLVDYRLYWYLQATDTPTGIFYRDIYWQFPELFEYSGIKYWELQARFRVDLAVMSRVADELYVPSSSFGERLKIDISTTPLPPGGIDRTKTNSSASSPERAIYVGGISERYGSELLSKSLEAVAESHDITLDLVCREPEFQSLSKSVRNRFESGWAKIHHVHGEELQPLYQRADIGVIPILPTTYNDMTMPVKLFEYLSYGLPVVTTDTTEIASFVRASGCGIVCNANHNDLARGVTELVTDEELYRDKQQNAVGTLKRNRWIDRASRIVSDLTEESYFQ